MITLKTLPQATAQEVFDQVARHLLTQNKTSENENGGQCLYRSDNGLKCAAGCLISAEEYDITFENKTWRELAFRNLAPKNHVELIVALQNVHDDFFCNGWHRSLDDVATRFNLSTQVLDEFNSEVSHA